MGKESFLPPEVTVLTNRGPETKNKRLNPLCNVLWLFQASTVPHTPWSVSSFFPSGNLKRTFYAFLVSHTRYMSCPSVLLDFIILLIYAEVYKV
jgi:hypothetical protein